MTVINKLPLDVTRVACCVCGRIRKVKFFDNWKEDRLCVNCVKLFEKYPSMPIEKLIEIIRAKKQRNCQNE